MLPSMCNVLRTLSNTPNRPKGLPGEMLVLRVCPAPHSGHAALASGDPAPSRHGAARQAAARYSHAAPRCNLGLEHLSPLAFPVALPFQLLVLLLVSLSHLVKASLVGEMTGFGCWP